MDPSLFPSEDALKQKFVNYFSSGKTVVQARKLHQNELRSLDNFSELFLTSRKMNPTQRTVRAWYAEWRVSLERSRGNLRERSILPNGNDNRIILRRLADLIQQCNLLLRFCNAHTSSLIRRIELSTRVIFREKNSSKLYSKKRRPVNFKPKYKLIN